MRESQQVIIAQEFASRIDHTILKPEATVADVDRFVDDAIAFGFASVCVAPPFVSHVAKRLAGTGVRTCSVVGFPNGTHKTVIKMVEATSTIKDGADEIDVVIHLPHLLSFDLAAAHGELIEIVRAARAVRADVTIKAIVESAVLLQCDPGRRSDIVKLACRAVRESGCDFIKTSTGFHPAGGASTEAVMLMKQHGEGLQIKASGGIRSLADARAVLDAGADRLGMSASTAVVRQLKASAI